MPPGICAVGCFSVRHNPDVPFLGIDGTGGQAEGVVARIVEKGTACSKFLTVNRELFPQALCDLEGGFSLLNQPVHHLHELIPTILVGLRGVGALLGADDQSHSIHCGTTTVIQTPFVHAGRGGFHVLVQRAFLVRVQLGGVGTGCGLQSNTGNVGVVIFSEQLDLALKRRGIPGGNRALVRLGIVVGKGLPFFKAAVLQFSIIRCILRRRRQRQKHRHQQAQTEQHRASLCGQARSLPVFPIVH